DPARDPRGSCIRISGTPRRRRHQGWRSPRATSPGFGSGGWRCGSCDGRPDPLDDLLTYLRWAGDDGGVVEAQDPPYEGGDVGDRQVDRQWTRFVIDPEGSSRPPGEFGI